MIWRTKKENAISCSTYARSPHQVLCFFTMSCRKWVWTQLWSIQDFPDAKKKQNIFHTKKASFTFAVLSKRSCLFMKAEASHNAPGYSCSKLPLCSPYVFVTLVFCSGICMLWVVEVVWASAIWDIATVRRIMEFHPFLQSTVRFLSFFPDIHISKDPPGRRFRM